MIDYCGIWLQSEGLRRTEIDRVRAKFSRVVAAYNAEPPTGSPAQINEVTGPVVGAVGAAVSSGTASYGQ